AVELVAGGEPGAAVGVVGHDSVQVERVAVKLPRESQPLRPQRLELLLEPGDERPGLTQDALDRLRTAPARAPLADGAPLGEVHAADVVPLVEQERSYLVLLGERHLLEGDRRLAVAEAELDRLPPAGGGAPVPRRELLGRSRLDVDRQPARGGPGRPLPPVV